MSSTFWPGLFLYSDFKQPHRGLQLQPRPVHSAVANWRSSGDCGRRGGHLGWMSEKPKVDNCRLACSERRCSGRLSLDRGHHEADQLQPELLAEVISPIGIDSVRMTSAPEPMLRDEHDWQESGPTRVR